MRSDGPARSGVWDEQPGNIRVYGSDGALRVFHYANQLFLRTAAGVEQIPLDHTVIPSHFGAEMMAFVRSVRDDTEVEVSAEAGRAALRTILAGYESMGGSCWPRGDGHSLPHTRRRLA